MGNVTWQQGHITREQRSKLLGHDNKVLWFTGLSGSGKSTVAHALEKTLHEKGVLTYALDGDNLRHGLNKNLGFSAEDRDENIRRVSEVAKLFHDSGVMVLVSFISPHRVMRDHARQLIGKDFVEVFVDCPLSECEKRDVKGLYKRARAGEIKEFTGISAPYEPPLSAEIVIDTSIMSIEASVQRIIDHLKL